MKAKRLLAGFLSAAMLLGTSSFSAFADETEQKIKLTAGEFTAQRNMVTEYTNSTVTYEIDGKVEIEGDKEKWTNVLNASVTGVGDVKTVKFVGTTEDAEINIAKGPAILAWQGHALNVEFENLTLSNSDPRYVGDIGHGSNFFTTFLRCANAENSSVTYTKCSFVNGACNNQYGKTSFIECSFKNSANYALWIYGEYKQADVEISKSTFTGIKGIKVYSERGAGTAFVNTKISDSKFENITGKPAIVSCISGNIEVTGTTFENCPKGLVENSGKEWNDHTPLANITIDGKEPEYTYTANGNLYTDADYGKAEGESLQNGGRLQIPNPGTPKVRTANAAFTSLDDAVASLKTATGDVTITLLDDAKWSYDASNNSANWFGNDALTSVTVEGNNHTLLMYGTNSDWSALKLTNPDGKFVFKNLTMNKDNNGGNIGPWNHHGICFDSYVEFENITVNNLVAVSAGASFKNVNFNEDSTEKVNYTLWIQTKSDKDVVLDGCKLKATNGARGIKIDEEYVTNGGGTVKTANLTIKDTSFEITGDKPAVYIYSKEGAEIKAENVDISKVAADDKSLVWVKTQDDLDKVTVTDLDENPIENGVIVEGSLAESVSAVFKKSTDAAADDEALYDLYIEADAGTINRLTSAEFAFNLTTTDDITYAVVGTDKVNVKEENGKYLFNFDGKTAADETGAKIKIGQIKFVGYGTFSFEITGDKNVVNATTKVDNIVNTFVTAPSTANEGKLTTSDKLTDVTIQKPVQKLTVNIMFNNDVKLNRNVYQDMTLTISGGDLDADKVIVLGMDNDPNEVSYATDANGVHYYHAIVKDLLTKNSAYTVTVEGAGYRTARYTVTMTADKTLNFWNNVKSAEAYIEEGKDVSKTTKNFLAGDIVKDGKINIYDLSAVVSYFGTTNATDVESANAKYDLNRDGVIDSKDVAYVLVSWGE